MMNLYKISLLTIGLLYQLILSGQVTVNHNNASVALCKENLMQYELESSNGTWPSELELVYVIDNLANAPLACEANPSRLSIEDIGISSADNPNADTEVIIALNNTGTNVFVTMDLSGISNPTNELILSFSLFIDCSLIPASPGLQTQIVLLEDWPALNTDDQYVVAFPYFSASLNSTQVGPNAAGQTVRNFSNTFYSSHSTPWDLEFMFDNDELFACDTLIDPNASLYEFSIDDGVSWNSFSPNTWTPISGIVTGSSFRIRHSFVLGCAALCNNVEAEFNWRCVGSENIPMACSYCHRHYTEIYALTDTRIGAYQVSRLCPSSSADTSCPGDTVSWAYKITNTGERTLYDFDFTLDYVLGSAFPNLLTLIDSASIAVGVYTAGTVLNWTCNGPLPASNCAYCDIVEDSITYGVFTNRNQFYVNPGISNYDTRIARLDAGDYFIVTFNTIKCGQISQEDEEDMFNQKKLYFNKYRATFKSKNSCGVIVNSTPSIYVSNEGAYFGGENMSLGLTFLPATTDLIVPPGTPLGDDGGGADFFVRTNSLVYNAYTNPVFGQASYAGNQPLSGVMKVVIETDPGLRITADDVHNVVFQSYDLSSMWPKMAYKVFNAPGSQCDSNSYTFYYNLNHFAGYTELSQFFSNARLDFRLTSCCFADSVPDYRVKFYLMPNQPSCYNLTYPASCCETDIQCDGSCNNFENCSDCVWYPLSRVGSYIHVHCPGCLAPGVIVTGYNIERTSLGLEDQDGDRVADGSGIPITSGYSRYPFLNLNSSNFGDLISDTLRAYFFDGDPTSDGYSYPGNMLSNGNNALLDVLQLDRSMTNMNRMNLTLSDFTLYIDAPTAAPNPVCCDCENYYDSANPGFETLLVLHVSSDDLSDYVQRFDIGTHDGQYFFTFHASDLMNVTNCSNQSLFNGFQVFQNYRLVCNYRVCGNFVPTGGDPETMKTSEINNRMWLSGIAQSNNAFGNIDQMPNDIFEVLNENAGYIDNGNLVFNSGFENNYIFYCETFGGRHYYYSTYAHSRPYITADHYPSAADWCTKIFINPTRVIVGSGDVYPFEFKTPQVSNAILELDVPDYWKVVKILYSATGQVYDQEEENAVELDIDLPIQNPQNGNFVIPMSAIGLPPLECLNEDNETDLNVHKLRDESLTQNIITYLQPIDCDYHPSPSLNGFLNLHFSASTILSCMLTDSLPEIPCSLNLTASTSSYFGIPALLSPNPDVSINFTPASIGAESNTVCWDFYISNPPTEGGITVAPFVYLSVPESDVLGNWSMTFGSQNASVAESDGIFRIRQTYPITSGTTNAAYTGTLCAEFTDCLPNALTTLSAFFGWNCGGFPTLDSLENVCGIDTVSFQLFEVNYNADLIVNAPTEYNSCEDIVVTYTVISIDDGHIYPTEIVMNELSPFLSIDGITVTSNNPQIDPIVDYDENTGVAILWDGQVNESIELEINESITIEVVYNTGCGLLDSLPNVDFNILNYCDSSIVLTHQYLPLVLNEDMCIPSCSACDTLSFSVIQDNGCTISFEAQIPAYDSCAYSQTVWDFGDGNYSNNNASNQTHYYSGSGSYLVSLSYTCFGEDSLSIFSCVWDSLINVTCGDSCTADFTITQKDNCCYLIEDLTPDVMPCPQGGFGIFRADSSWVATYQGVTSFEHCFEENGDYIICSTVCCADSSLHKVCQFITVSGCNDQCEAFEITAVNDGCNYSFTAVHPPVNSPTYGWWVGYNGIVEWNTTGILNHTYPPGYYQDVCYTIFFNDSLTNQPVECKVCMPIDVNCEPDCGVFDMQHNEKGDCKHDFEAILPPNFNGTNVSYCWYMDYNNTTFCPAGSSVGFTYPAGTYTICYEITYTDPNYSVPITCKFCREFSFECGSDKEEDFCYIIERREKLDEGKVITPLKNGGYLLAGELHGNSDSQDIYFTNVKDDFTSDYHLLLDEIIAERSDIGTVYSTLEVGSHVYILGRSAKWDASNSDIIIACLDAASQNIVWAKRYGTPKMDIGTKLLMIDEGKLVIVGHTNYYSIKASDYDLFTMCVDATGNLQDVVVYIPSEKNANEISTDAAILSDEHSQFVITGYNVNPAGTRDMIALKVNYNLAPTSSFVFVGDGNDEWANGVTVGKDYIYLVGASGVLKTKNYHIYVAELKASDLSQTTASRIFTPDFKNSVANKAIYRDKRLTLVGDLYTTKSDMDVLRGTVLHLVCDDKDGKHLDIDWSMKTFEENNVRFNHLSNYKDSRLLVTGTFSTAANDNDIFVVNMNAKDGEGCCVEPLTFEKKALNKTSTVNVSTQRPSIEVKSYGVPSTYFELKEICKKDGKDAQPDATASVKMLLTDFNVFPNPNAGYFSVQLSNKEDAFKSVTIFDMAGRKVFDRNYSNEKSGMSYLEINADELTNGVYLLQVEGLYGLSTKLISISK